jgi:hypothetical protein
MSHLTTIKTRLVSGKHIVQALQAMGYADVKYLKHPQSMQGFFGSSIKKEAEIIIRKKDFTVSGLLADVGFSKNGQGEFDWIITEEDRLKLGDDWYNQLSQRYSYYIVMNSLEQQGFSQVEMEREEDQSIRLVMRRMT